MSRLPNTGAVQILLDGLIVTRYDGEESTFELGVLDAPMHTFTICYEIRGPQRRSATQIILKDPGRLLLEIDGLPPDAERFYFAEPRRKVMPKPDSPAAQDFRWMLNLDDKDDFPKHPDPHMPLIYGKFQRIIHIKNGLIYNKTVSKSFLKRKLFGEEAEDFGHTSDMLAVDLDAKPGQEIVLKNTRTGKDLFREGVKQDESIGIKILNLPPPASGVSHFPMYYDVFSVDPKQHYDFLVPKAVSDPDLDSNADCREDIDSLAANDREAHADHKGHETSGAASDFDALRAVTFPKCGDGIGHPGMLCGNVTMGKFPGPIG